MSWLPQADMASGIVQGGQGNKHNHATGLRQQLVGEI
jgi:hypothetical protein